MGTQLRAGGFRSSRDRVGKSIADASEGVAADDL
jgi:hypothetical protein